MKVQQNNMISFVKYKISMEFSSKNKKVFP